MTAREDKALADQAIADAAAAQADANTAIADAATAQATANAAIPEAIGGAIGDLITFSAPGVPAAIAAGAAGEVLTGNGAGVAPTWQVSAARYPLVHAPTATTFPHTTYEVQGAAPYEIDDTPAPGKVRAFYCAVAAPAGFTLEVSLVDLSGGGVILLTLSTVSVTPVVLSGTFVVADATLRLYAVEVKLSGGVPAESDRGLCYGAYIEVT